MKLRVLALTLAILAFFLFVGSPFQQAANAVAAVDDAIIVILIAALAACGITFTTTGAFNSLQEYVTDLLHDYADDRGVTFNSLFTGIDSGVNNKGNILINNRFVQLVQTFGAWLKVELGLVDNNSTVVRPSTGNVGMMTAYKLPFTVTRIDTGNYNTYQYYRGNGALVVWLYSGWPTVNYNSVMPIFLSDVPCQVEVISGSSNGNPSSYVFELEWNETYQKYTNKTYNISYSLTYYTALSNVVAYTRGEFNEYVTGSVVPAKDSISLNTGEINLPLDDNNYTDGDGALIDAGAWWGAGYDDVIDGVIPGEFSFGEEAEISIDYVGEEEAADQIVESQGQVVSSEPSSYQVQGLTSVFPFCIPFDLYNFVACLAADPVAPSFTWRFYVPGICDEYLEIDLSEFDDAAQILRTMELLLFCVGLAFVTRKIIRG